MKSDTGSCHLRVNFITLPSLIPLFHFLRCCTIDLELKSSWPGILSYRTLGLRAEDSQPCSLVSHSYHWTYLSYQLPCLVYHLYHMDKSIGQLYIPQAEHVKQLLMLSILFFFFFPMVFFFFIFYLFIYFLFVVNFVIH